MKIAMIGPTYPYRGGISHYTSLMVEALRERHQVLFLSVSRAYPDFIYPGKTQADRSLTPVQCESEPMLSYVNPLSWRRVAERALSFDPDLVIIQWMHTAVTPQMRYISGHIRRGKPEVPILFVCHNVEQHENRKADRLMTRFALKRGDRFIVHDDRSMRVLAEIKPGSRITVADHPAYDMFAADAIPRGEARGALKLDAGADIVLFFGHVRPYKGLAQLVRALPMVAEEVPSLHLLVVGEFWEDRSAYEAELARNNLADRVTIVDRYVPNEDVAKYFCACDLVALPYVTATASGILQIAYSFARPVVATAVGSLTSCVDDGKTGYLVTQGDPGALAGAIIRFFKQRNSEAFERNIEEYRGRFAWENMVSVVEEQVK